MGNSAPSGISQYEVSNPESTEGADTLSYEVNEFQGPNGTTIMVPAGGTRDSEFQIDPNDIPPIYDPGFNQILALASYLTCMNYNLSEPEGSDCQSCSPTQSLQSSEWVGMAEEAMYEMKTSLKKKQPGASAFFKFQCKRSTLDTPGEVAVSDTLCMNVIVGVQKESNGSISYGLVYAIEPLILQAAYLAANQIPLHISYIEAVDWNSVPVEDDDHPVEKTFADALESVDGRYIMCRKRDENMIDKMVKRMYQKGYYMEKVDISPSGLPEYSTWGASQTGYERGFQGKLAPLGERVNVRGITPEFSEEEAIRRPEEAEEERMSVLDEEGVYVPPEARSND